MGICFNVMASPIKFTGFLKKLITYFGVDASDGNDIATGFVNLLYNFMPFIMCLEKRKILSILVLIAVSFGFENHFASVSKII